MLYGNIIIEKGWKIEKGGCGGAYLYLRKKRLAMCYDGTYGGACRAAFENF